MHDLPRDTGSVSDKTWLKVNDKACEVNVHRTRISISKYIFGVIRRKFTFSFLVLIGLIYLH